MTTPAGAGHYKFSIERMNTEHIKKYGVPAAAVLVSLGLGFASVSSAEGAPSATGQGQRAERGMRQDGARPVVMGTVTAVSGSTITIESKRPDATTGTSYTVDASGAKIRSVASGSAPAESSLSAITVGSTVAVRGTISGTSVTASEIMTGDLPRAGMGGPMGAGRLNGTHGTVSAISGSVITLTTADGKTFTVDASGATVSKTVQAALGDIKVGDTLGVVGSVSGTEVKAKHIMDGVPPLGETPQR